MERAELEERIKVESQTCERILAEVGRRIVGQKHVAARLLMGLIVEGHILLEGLPGLAKTTSIKALAEALTLSFRRIQFTPDLLPADVVGTQIYDPRNAAFRVKKGPIFANLVLADEINRAPAKVQSALLEAMQERQVTIGDETYRLEAPFLVLATQNPIEQEGTYPLPEAQIDRFLFKIKVGYGSLAEEEEIVARAATAEPTLNQVAGAAELARLKALVGEVYVADRVRRYIVQLVHATREPQTYGMSDLASLIAFGASPRASINLERAARANALLAGRGFVVPQDVKDVGLDVLRHRLLPTYEAEAENVSTDDMVRRLFERIDVP